MIYKSFIIRSPLIGDRKRISKYGFCELNHFDAVNVSVSMKDVEVPAQYSSLTKMGINKGTKR